MGVAFGVVMIAAGLVATFGTLHERPRLPSSPTAPSQRFDLRRTLLSTLRDRSFRVLVFSSALFAMAEAITAAMIGTIAQAILRTL